MYIVKWGFGNRLLTLCSKCPCQLPHARLAAHSVAAHSVETSDAEKMANGKLVNVRVSKGTDHTYDLAVNVGGKNTGKVSSIKGRSSVPAHDHDHYDMASG